MISRFVAVAALGAMAACSSSIPDSNPNAGGGIGFGDPSEFEAQRAARDRQLEARIAPVQGDQAIATETLQVLGVTPTASGAGGDVIAANNAGVAGGEFGNPSVATSILANNPGISDEQNFDAVASRETIESDRDRLQRQRDAFQVAQPQAVPERPRGTGPNIVEYALSTSNEVGVPVHNRSGRFNQDKYRLACAEFGSSDQAQTAFLESGGPNRDRKGLDPDGDGFACRWDPTPFRNARVRG